MSAVQLMYYSWGCEELRLTLGVVDFQANTIKSSRHISALLIILFSANSAQPQHMHSPQGVGVSQGCLTNNSLFLP